MLVAGDAGGKTHVFDLRSHALMRIFGVHSHACGVATGVCARRAPPHASATAQVHVARFSADGTRVFTASDDARAIWDVAAEAQVRTFEGHCDRVRSGRINPASADLHGCAARSPGGPASLRAPRPPASRKLAIPLPSPGSSHPPATASSSYDHTVRLWDAGSPRSATLGTQRR